MRTCVRMMMGQAPYRPVQELEAAIARGELDFALAHAKEVARERAGPLNLELALELVALVASQQAEAYDAWALRWLARWIGEAREPTVAQAAALAVAGQAAGRARVLARGDPPRGAPALSRSSRCRASSHRLERGSASAPQLCGRTGGLLPRDRSGHEIGSKR